ncbi:MAG: hypothetical protein NZM11_08100 [Anaerolineales bacterium]|nr:hypothetical protein [Anaerolineales bacterium]
MTAKPLDSIRTILLPLEQRRLRALELESLKRQSEARLLALQAELDAIHQAGDIIAEAWLEASQAEAAELRRLLLPPCWPGCGLCSAARCASPSAIRATTWPKRSVR